MYANDIHSSFSLIDPLFWSYFGWAGPKSTPLRWYGWTLLQTWCQTNSL